MNNNNNTSQHTKILSTPIQLGDLKLKNRFVQAPLTRLRSVPDTGMATDLMNTYYTQRSHFGLIITETVVNQSLKGLYPCLATQAQAEGWKQIVESVHKAGGLICLQISHGGRSNVSSMGVKPLAPSAIKLNGKNKFANNEPFEEPLELTLDEIQQIKSDFKQSAILAKEAGFDAIQLHSANGYLVDQFLRESANQRTDEYGGNIQNRCRFCLEVIDELISVFGSGRVSIRLSPVGRYNQMYDSDPIALMKYLFSELDQRKISFIELRRFGRLDLTAPVVEGQVKSELQIPDFFKNLRQYFKGNIIANDGVSIKEGEELALANIAQAISFGKMSISNPDLPLRYENDWEINYHPDHTTFYTSGPEGYIDYPNYQQQKQTQKQQDQQQS